MIWSVWGLMTSWKFPFPPPSPPLLRTKGAGSDDRHRGLTVELPSKPSKPSSSRRRGWTHKLLPAMVTLLCGFLSRRSALTPSSLLEEPPAQISAKELWVSHGVLEQPVPRQLQVPWLLFSSRVVTSIPRSSLDVLSPGDVPQPATTLRWKFCEVQNRSPRGGSGTV